MKTFYLLFLLIILQQQVIAQKAFSDELKYKATYEITYQPDSTDVGSVRSEEMVLYMGDHISRFSSSGTAVGDSLMANRDRSNKSMGEFARLRAQIPDTKFDYYIYKGIPGGKLSYTRKFVKDNYQYIDDLDMFNWEMHPETKQVAGYNAQKATTNYSGRNYTAWFTSEIPVSDGPYKFNGLPGLIIEVKDQQGHYSFVLTEFQVLDEPVPVTFEVKDYLLMKKEKFHDIIRKYEQDPFAAMEQQGMSFGFKPGQKEKLLKESREEKRKENNPIELK